MAETEDPEREAPDDEPSPAPPADSDESKASDEPEESKAPKRPDDRGARAARVRLFLIATAILGLGLAAYYLFFSTLALPAEPLAGVPVDTPAVMEIDLRAVFASRAYQEFIRGPRRDRGIRAIEEKCGFNPLDQFDRVIVYVTGEESTSIDHFGYAAEGPLDHEALGECVRKALEEDGGGIERIDIDGVPAVAGTRGDSRIAFVGRRALVGGNEAQVRQVIRVLRGEEPSASTRQELVDLWTEVSRGRDAALVARIPQRWRDSARERIVAFGLEEGFGVIGHLKTAGIGVSVQNGIEVGAVFYFDDEDSAETLAATVQGRIAEIMRNPFVVLTAAGSMLRRIQVEARGDRLTLTASVRENELDVLATIVARAVEPTPSPFERQPPNPEPDPNPNP